MTTTSGPNEAQKSGRSLGGHLVFAEAPKSPQTVSGASASSLIARTAGSCVRKGQPNEPTTNGSKSYANKVSAEARCFCVSCVSAFLG